MHPRAPSSILHRDLSSSHGPVLCRLEDMASVFVQVLVSVIVSSWGYDMSVYSAVFNHVSHGSPESC